MTFMEYLTDGFRTLGFNQEAVQRNVQDPEIFKNGLLAALVISALNAIVSVVSALFAYTPAMYDDVVLAPSAPTAAEAVVAGIVVFIVTFIFIFIGYGILHLSAKILGGKTSIKVLFGTMLASSIYLSVLQAASNVLGSFSLAGKVAGSAIVGLASLYMIAVGVYIVKNVYGFSTGRAIATVLIPLAVVFLIVMLLFAALFAAWFGLYV